MTEPTGKKRLREIIRKLIQQFRESNYNLIQRKRNSILTYRALRSTNVAGFLANPQRNTRWGTLIPQAIADQLEIPQLPPREDQDPTVSGRRLIITHPRGAGFVEEFNPTPSLVDRSDAPPDDFVRDHSFKHRMADLQEALSASRPLPLTEPQEDEMDDLYSILMAQVHEPMDESEPLLPGRRQPTLRRRQGPEERWKAVQDSVTMFVRDNVRTLRYSPVSASTPTSVDYARAEPAAIRRKDRLSNLRLEFSASEVSIESESDQNTREGHPGWV